MAGTSAAVTGAMTACSFGVTPTSFRPDPIRIGLVGCGGRGNGAAMQCMIANENVELVAMADLFPDKLEIARQALDRVDSYNVDDEMCFTGFDGYRKLLETDIDVVLLATPPVFRPMMFEAAVEAGKHVFMEKPVGVDAVGLGEILETAKKAQEKKLSVVVGLQYRYHPVFQEAIKRIHDGALGKLVTARAISNSRPNRVVSRKEGWSDMEFQLRDWYFFIWAGGDIMPEYHLHMLDVANWAIDSLPTKCMGMGGRHAYPEIEGYGNTWDNFAVDYEYPDDVRLTSLTRRWPGRNVPGKVITEVVGTKGTAVFSEREGVFITGENAWKYEGPRVSLLDAYKGEHVALIGSIRNGTPINDAFWGVDSTLVAIMGRDACYTGAYQTWEDTKKSELDLTPRKFEFGDLEVRPSPVPGKKWPPVK